jgi:hypothetical protein
MERLRNQTGLPFAEAEGSHSERRNVLELALMRCRADLTLARLLLTVFSATAGGKEGATYKRTLQELAASDRWGLWCSPKTAQRAVDRARDLGLLLVEATRGPAGEQRANEYAIDWPGIYAALNLSRRPGSVPPPRPSSAGGQNDLGAGQSDHHIKEVEISSNISLPPPAPSTTSGAAAVERFADQSRPDRPGDRVRDGRAVVEPGGGLVLLSVEGGRSAWSAVEPKLRAAGAVNAAELVELARSQGRTPGDLERVAAVLAANPGRLQKPGGAARWFLERGEWPQPGLIDPVAQAERAQRDLERRRAVAQANAERDRDRLEGQAQIEDLEARRGPQLDGLSEADRDELAAQAIGAGGPVLRSYRAGAWRSPRSVCRSLLLERLDQIEASAGAVSQ